ncbi:MAG: hypothetical protein COZ06_22960 [Armatimonadetes bacterium CG_4_10_14_3_um_filter_66_18]|nr:hypothetical protein [Armatimonadota bacterium]OIP02239.1 MAG: hypothetical protein AUJ96_16495 [Armatimonadetes bacterium CG2_30_66_41]PIU94106.1 MAG: hypothetical protein COS65_09325 [Armatimonadetes bacterium CG06_land_8_20_14_3_00_66_21]PIX47239.1 MAG: hypothetical protein COZ57_09070 [Armatimonadetes bacterium CG_4_8_14_3_um_filter_66_20]PIY43397.1 MAG: hypothetical protein COZ06_22960 [Armatimonadetes bacterium CG_4_10_14_3_um_filter_66_18]PIZ46274.1 MAG: hypothetical protein COY42_10
MLCTFRGSPAAIKRQSWAIPPSAGMARRATLPSGVAQGALREAPANGEIVSVSVNILDPNPWLEYAGRWRDMPEDEWALYQQAIEDYRQELAEDEAVV